MVGVYKVFGHRIGSVGGRALTFKKPKDLLVGCADTNFRDLLQRIGSQTGSMIFSVGFDETVQLFTSSFDGQYYSL